MSVTFRRETLQDRPHAGTAALAREAEKSVVSVVVPVANAR